MKLISWNVNGLRACLTHDFAASFAALDADVFSVQETKMQPGQADFAPEGYTEYTYSAEKKGYSGTACWCKTVPLSVTSRQVRAYKISKRFDCDISALCAGFSIELDGKIVKTVRLAFGGMAATVKRAARAEAALLGKPWTQENVKAAQAALAEDFKPMSDMRASAEYRNKVAANLIQRLWLETRLEQALDAKASTVWSVMPHEVNTAAQGV